MAAVTTTLLVSALALSAASAGIGAYSSIQQGKAQEDAAKFNAAVARNNAIASQEQAQFDADRIRNKNRKVLGLQRAALAANGVELTGSAADLMFDSSVQSELEVAAAIYQGKVSAGAQNAQASLYERQGKDARTGSYWSATGTILGGASQGISLYSNPNLNPTFGKP
jgi:hypothetical protein